MEEERRTFFEDRGMEIEKVERRGEGEEWFGELKGKDKKKQRKERWRNIKDSWYSRWYGKMKGEGIPKYLKKGWGESRWQRVVGFRLGNELREGKYWGEEEKRACRLCGKRDGRKGRHRNMYGKSVENGQREKVVGRERWVGC